MNRARISTALACALAWSGCGGSDVEPAPERPSVDSKIARDDVASARLVSDRAIAKKDADSPERALLSWFQAVQFQDVSGTKLLTAEEALAQTNDEALATDIRTVSTALGNPRIVLVRASGDAATVRVLVQGFDAEDKLVSRAPATFELVREADQWKLADLSYLTDASRSVTAAP